MVRLSANGLQKHFNLRKIFSGISFDVSAGQCLAISGANGAGKSTLVKIICGLLQPNSGTVALYKAAVTDQPLNQNSPEFQNAIGFVAPYLQLYRDLSARENVELLARARHGKPDGQRLAALFQQMGLQKRENDLLKTYSSGMLQRAKYVAALYHQPDLLILDEPGANLDDSGKEIVHRIIADQKQRGLVVVATNEADEVALGDQLVRLD